MCDKGLEDKRDTLKPFPNPPLDCQNIEGAVETIYEKLKEKIQCYDQVAVSYVLELYSPGTICFLPCEELKDCQWWKDVLSWQDRLASLPLVTGKYRELKRHCDEKIMETLKQVWSNKHCFVISRWEEGRFRLRYEFTKNE